VGETRGSGLGIRDSTSGAGLARLARGLDAGTMGRRAFVWRALALGASAGTIAELLAAACRPIGDGLAPAARVARDAAEAEQPLGPIERRLAIYNWSDYVAPDTIPNFEREFHVRVTYDVYESNEELLAKLLAGANGYDLVFPSSYALSVLVATGQAAPVHRQYLTNWGNIAPLFRDPAFDPGNVHSVPWQWGITGLAYRADRVARPDSWAVLQDPRYAGKMTQLDDGRDVIGSWLRFRGHSLNSRDPRLLQVAKADAIAAKRNLRAYLSAPVKGQLISGDVWIAQLWNGDATQAKAEQPAIEYALPAEGSTIWADSVVMPRSAPHPRAAHEFMNYILRPEVGAAISDFTGYGTPNQEALTRMAHPVPYPTPDQLRRLEYQVDLGRDTAEWDQLWTEIKSA
jgi:spermidine/putrescine transport system substrate-binding protein